MRISIQTPHPRTQPSPCSTRRSSIALALVCFQLQANGSQVHAVVTSRLLLAFQLGERTKFFCRGPGAGFPGQRSWLQAAGVQEAFGHHSQREGLSIPVCSQELDSVISMGSSHLGVLLCDPLPGRGMLLPAEKTA